MNDDIVVTRQIKKGQITGPFFWHFLLPVGLADLMRNFYGDFLNASTLILTPASMEKERKSRAFRGRGESDKEEGTSGHSKATLGSFTLAQMS